MTEGRHVFISPHLDDVVLSCGGYLNHLSRTGRHVTAVTVMTADWLGPISWVARRNLASWGLGDADAPFATRRQEDEEALDVLATQAVHLGFLDAIYRSDDEGQPLYTKRTIDVPVHSYDWTHTEPAVRERLRRVIAGFQPSEATVYCPLGIGGHVDHLIVRQAVEEIADPCGIVYYEEQPYAARTGEPLSSLSPGEGSNAPFPVVVKLTEEDLEAWARATACYESQLPGLFPSRMGRFIEILRARLPFLEHLRDPSAGTASSRARMASSLRAYAERIGGERHWHRCPDRLPALASLEKRI